MPNSNTMSVAMMMVSVIRAFLVPGSRKAFTPLLTASTPVIAVQPLAKLCSSSHVVTTVCGAGGRGGATTGTGCPPLAKLRTTPIAIMANRLATNRQVGAMKSLPASRRPRRLMRAMMARMTRQSVRVCGCKRGSAEVSAPTPAEMPTATTRM